MMSRKLIFLTLSLLLCFALMAAATETRVATMGNSGLYLKDDAGIFIYPGTMTMYKKMIIAEHFSNIDGNVVGPFSYGRFRRVGIVFPAWGSSTLAVFAGDGREDFTVQGTTITEPTTRFLLGYGVNTGNASLGLQLDFSGVRTENPFGVPQGGGLPTIFTASTWGIAAGLSTPMGDLNNLDLGFRIRIGNFETKQDTTAANNKLNESDGNTTLSFVARDYYALNDYVNLVPVGKFGVSTQKDVEFVGDTSRFKNTITTIEAGLGVQTKPTENSEIIAGAGYRTTNTNRKAFTPNTGADSVELQITDTHLPFAFLGFEAMVKSWMHFRLGVEKTVDVFKQEQKGPLDDFATNAPNRNESKQGGSTLDYAVGVGIHSGPVTMDALVSNNFFTNGPYFLSGDAGNNMFPRITFMYNFK
jgi:opacity protein-like surface antigen